MFNLDGTPATGQSTVCDESTSGTSYSLRGTFNNTIIFDVIPEGYYYFSIWVWDNDGFDKEVIHNEFTVGNPLTEPIPQGSALSEEDGAGQTLPDGDYQIFSGINPFYYLDIEGIECPAVGGTNISMCTVEEHSFLESFDCWTLEYLNNGFYRIKQMGTTMCLDVTDASLNRGTNVQICTQNDSFAQQWSIIRTSSGYKIRSRCNGYYLDVSGGDYASGTNVWVWEGNDTAAQKYAFVPYGPSVGQTIKDGVYTILSAVNSGYCIDVDGTGEYKSGDNIQIWEADSLSDAFKVEHLGDGYYRISEVTTDLSVDLWSGDLTTNLNSQINIMLCEKTSLRMVCSEMPLTVDAASFIVSISIGSDAAGVSDVSSSVSLVSRSRI